MLPSRTRQCRFSQPASHDVDVVAEPADVGVLHRQHVAAAEVEHHIGADLCGKRQRGSGIGKAEIVQLDRVDVVLEVGDRVDIGALVEVEPV